MNLRPTGLSPEIARAIVPMLDLVLTRPGLDRDTERRTQWLRMRMVELAPDLALPSTASMIDMRLSALTA